MLSSPTMQISVLCPTLPMPPRLVGGGVEVLTALSTNLCSPYYTLLCHRGIGNLTRTIIYVIPFYRGNLFHQIRTTQMCACVVKIPHIKQMPLPKGILLTPLIIPTHHKPGRVGHNSDMVHYTVTMLLLYF